MDNWQKVWSAKSVPVGVSDVTAALIRANGFDTGSGDYTVAQWTLMVEDLVERLQIGPNSRVLEVGCGAGALLHVLSACSGAAVYGYDYSSSLIDAARQQVNGDFRSSEATINPFVGMRFDVVLSHSVFQYFPDQAYARRVVGVMCDALEGGGRIAVLDVNDAALEANYHSHRRAASPDPGLYAEKYRNHPHAFYDRAALREWMQASGITEVRTFGHAVPDYLNSRYRFNLMGIKA